MRVIVDTNVVMSAIFFGGKPRVLLDSWIDGQFDLAISLEIANHLNAIY